VTFSITIGEGRQRPQGRAAALTPPPVQSLYELLKSQPARVERWWSVHLWERDYRVTKGWRASIGVAVDLDYRVPDSPPSPEVAARLADAARSGRLPGSLFHLTPHGARVIFVYEIPCTHREMQVSASKGAAALVERALADLDLFDYVVDPCTWDLARFYYTPNSVAKGVARSADLVLMREVPFEVDVLAAEEPPEVIDTPPEPAQPARRVVSMDESIKEIIARWNADHRQIWPSKPSTCPACQHKDCFHALPDDDTKWVCFSTNHGDEVGRPTKEGKAYWGDALDLEAHERRVKPIDVLRADGYLTPVRRPAAQAIARSSAQPQPKEEPDPADVVPINPVAAPAGGRRVWRSRSYLTTVEIIRQNARDVLEGRTLELNELTGRAELARKPMTDVEITRIRSLIESRFVGGIDKNQNEIGMVQSKDDIACACDQVAAERPYNPLRAYLDMLAWDGVERISALLEDVLDAEKTAINLAMLRRFFVSAVARALSPGCKVDTVLILCGRQGAGKSSFFRILGGEWFVDTAVDLRDKDSFQVLRGAWLYEWAELEALNRARDSSAAKAFLSSPIDRYRPSYGRLVIDVPRTCVIVGSTNKYDFLEDETGNRRFWPIKVGALNVELLAKWRDQLWAEAVAAFKAGETWWLGTEDLLALATQQEAFQATDAWDGQVLELAMAGDFTTADVLRHALKKEVGSWTKADEMRVAKILRRAGFELTKLHGGRRVWRRVND
jgi:predicted P-loop ATPase